MLNNKVINKLIKIAQKELDKKIQEKLSQDNIISKIELEINNLSSDVEKEKKIASDNSELTAAFPNYYKRMKQKLLSLASDITAAHHQLDEIVEQLKEAHIEIKKYQTIKDNIKKRLDAKAESKERKEIDEFNIINYSNKKI